MSDFAKRYRAARAWADLDQAELAEQLGVDRQTVIRRESGAQDPKRQELLAVAAICGVPADFMLNGFVDAVIAKHPTLDDRLSAIWQTLQELSGEAADRDLEALELPEQSGGTAGQDEPGQDDQAQGGAE